MVALPSSGSQTVSAIFAYHVERAAKTDWRRPHLGASMIGRDCSRELWFSFRWATPPKFDGRMYRLFQTGDLAEGRFVTELRNIGVEVLDKDPETGSQWRLAHGAHIGGSMDGAGVGVVEAPKTWHVFEFKTHNDQSFTKLQSEGVERAKPEHWAQMQLYMLWSGMTRALYLAANKNNDDLYSERVRFDIEAATRLQAKAERIVAAETPPEGISADPSFFKCKWCEQAPICHKLTIDALAPVHCRSCAHSTADEDGWTCEKHGWRQMSAEQQRQGCSAHVYHPDMVPGTASSSDGTTVTYKMVDGSTWTDAPKGGAA